MNISTYLASTDMSRNKTVAAMWIFFFFILNEICAGESLEVTSDICGEEYNMDVYNKLEVTHSGENLLNKNPCSVLFTKTSLNQNICISVRNSQLDCYTSLEYHEGFVSEYADPEVKMSCNGVINSEWCANQYQNNVYIAIRKSSRRTSDVIKLRVYVKDVSEDDFSDSSAITAALSISIPIAIIGICSVFSYVCKPRKRKKTSAARNQTTHQTSPGATDIQAGIIQPNNLANPHILQSGLQGNYNVHPIQTAYPAQQGATSLNMTIYSQQDYSSAPQMDISAPPPSYESIVSERS